MQESMLIVTSSWNDRRTFKMIPLSHECPYNECIFDPENKVLAIVSKDQKKNFQIIPQLSMAGTEIGSKERVKLDTYYEYFIEEKEEILSMVSRLAANKQYDYKKIIEESFN